MKASKKFILLIFLFSLSYLCYLTLSHTVVKDNMMLSGRVLSVEKSRLSNEWYLELVSDGFVYKLEFLKNDDINRLDINNGDYLKVRYRTYMISNLFGSKLKLIDWSKENRKGPLNSLSMVDLNLVCTFLYQFEGKEDLKERALDFLVSKGYQVDEIRRTCF